VTGASLDPGATLLLLTPKPSASPRESLAANIAAKCLKLHDEAAARPEGGQSVVSPALAPCKQTLPERKPEAKLAGASAGASAPLVEATAGPTYRVLSHTPATPRTTETSMWQKIIEWEHFSVDNWLKDANTHGRNAAEQVSDLTKMVGQMQALIRVMAGQLKVSATAGSMPGGVRQRTDVSSMDATSPRMALNSPYATPSRQIHNMPTHALASTGNLAACSPRHPVSGEETSSPLTRSCSANYPVGTILSHKGSGLLSIVGEVQSPATVKRDLSPSEFRQVQAAPKASQQSRSPAYWMSPWQQSATVSQPLQPAPAHVQDGHILHSPRTEQGPVEGQRSPLPPVSSQYVKTAHPNSARTPAPGAIPILAEGGSTALRWEPSPYRVRLVSGSAAKVHVAPVAGARTAAPQVVAPHHVAVRIGEVRRELGSKRSKVQKTGAKKAKSVTSASTRRGLTGKEVKRLSKGLMQNALRSQLKKKSGRKDIRIKEQPQLVYEASSAVPITDRAGYPVVRKKGSVDPKNWVSATGVKVEVDFSRCSWLPDDWGQGVKITKPNSRSKAGGNGGTLTTFVSPEMKMYFHKEKVEEHVGRKLTSKDGFQGQVRLARLQAQQTIQLARQQIKEVSKGGAPSFIGADKDSEFFSLLSRQEKKYLPSKDEFHFAVVSARRATKLEGVRDIVSVQMQLQEAGVTPTWYVDAESLEDYKALGLKAVVGGKLTPSRNKALNDAAASKKICVQLSDDISAWEYRHGKKAAERTDDAMNQAYAAARRFIVTPVAAARFIVAKMRASDEKPKLGGVYMLGSCARTFAGPQL
ncbi:unnamed protein product, partial [Symbiodinium pilosum]